MDYLLLQVDVSQYGYNVKVYYKMHENIQKESDKRYAVVSSLI